MDKAIFWWPSWNSRQCPWSPKLINFVFGTQCHWMSICAKFQVCSRNSLRNMENAIFWQPSWNWRHCHLGSKIYKFSHWDTISLCAPNFNSAAKIVSKIFWWPSWNWRQCQLMPQILTDCLLRMCAPMCNVSWLGVKYFLLYRSIKKSRRGDGCHHWHWAVVCFLVIGHVT